LLLLLTNCIWGQSVEKMVTAKIVVDTTAIEKVNVLNMRNYQNAVSDKRGIFKMMLRADDALVITAVNLETRRKIITAEDLDQEVLPIKMSYKMNQLEEVDVNGNSKINSENLGITSKGQKRYTPAERKLRTATTGLLDPLLNKMSGRTTQLKKEVLVERNERLLIKLDGWFEDKYYTDTLKIPADYIQGFQYYIIEDPDFARALVDKNKTLTMFYVKRLAVEYNDLIRAEEPVKTE
jgi:hypothetical protein